MSDAISSRNLTAAVVFSTRFGTTEKVAKSIEAGLNESGIKTTCMNTEVMAPESLRQFDLICIGGPTEMFGASKEMRNYLKSTKGTNLAGKLGFAFDTKLDSSLSGSASKYIEHALDDQGLHVVFPRKSAIVTNVKQRGAIVGAVLRDGEERRFEELGRLLGEKASQALEEPKP